MKEENVLKFLAVGIYLGGTNSDFQMEHYIYKGKRDGIYIINLRRTWRTFCQLVPWLPLKTQLTSRPCLSGILVSELGWSLPLPRDLLPFPAATLPEPSVTRSRQLSENRDFWWLLIPELTTSLSQRRLVTILCNTLLCALWSLPPVQEKRSPPSWSHVVMLAWEFPRMRRGSVSRDLPQAVSLIYASAEKPEEIEKEE